MQEYLALWKNYFNFKDRTTVRGFWMAILFNVLVAFVLTALAFMADALTFLYPLYCLAAFIPGLAIEVRRLHDINKSGWWLFIAAVPLVGAILLLVWFCKASVDEDNKFGTAQV